MFEALLNKLDPATLAQMLVKMLDQPEAMDKFRAGLRSVQLDDATRAKLLVIADVVIEEWQHETQTIEHGTGQAIAARA